MIITETRKIGEREFTYTYSDKNMMIQRNGIMYSEAYDPIEMHRVYTETRTPIPKEEVPSQEEQAPTA